MRTSAANERSPLPSSGSRTDLSSGRRILPIALTPPARHAAQGEIHAATQRFKGITGHRVTRGGKDVHLGPTEYRLLDFLMQRPGRVFSRERLLDAVWGANTYVEVRTVDVHVGRLRKALRLDGEPDLIRTVRSAGYALDTEG